jgi:hypothetical protein
MKSALPLLLLAGCAHEVVTPPAATTFHVIVDEDFSEAEREDVILGIDAWTTAVGADLKFSYSTAPHATLLDAPGRNTGELHILRLSTLGDLGEPCLLQATWVACYADGRAYLGMDDIFAYTGTSPTITNPDQLAKTLTSHEIGHFLGLDHAQGDVVMAADPANMSLAPTRYDAEAYCAGVGVGERCPLRDSRDR